MTTLSYVSWLSPLVGHTLFHKINKKNFDTKFNVALQIPSCGESVVFNRVYINSPIMLPD